MHQPDDQANTGTSKSRERTSSWRDLVPPLWLIVLVLAYTATYGALSIVKHNTFHSHILDLGIMSQVIWNTGQGRVFEVSVDRPLDTELVGSYLGNHVRPIFLLLAPLYRLWPDPRMLLILQSALLGLGALPLWWIARREVSDLRLQVAVVVSYIFYPALGYLNLYHFHPVAFTIPFLFLAYWALLEKKNLLFWTMIVLTLMTKEEMAIPIAAFGVYCLFRPTARKQGVALLLLAGLWAYLTLFVIIPHYNEGRPYRFFALWSALWSALPAVLNGGGELSGGVNLLGIYSRFNFVTHLMLPLSFLPLLNPGLLAVSLPSLAYLLLSNHEPLYSVGYQFPAVLIPWLFLAAVYGLAWLERRLAHDTKSKFKTLALVSLLAGTVLGGVIFAPIPKYWRYGFFSPIPHQAQVEAALAQVPPQASVATNGHFGPHLTHRRRLLMPEQYQGHIPTGHLQQIDYVLLDLVDCRAPNIPDSRADYTEMVHQILATDEFGVHYWSERILLLKRGDAGKQELAQVRAYLDSLLAEERPCWP